MGSQILFAAGPQDMKELNAFIHSLGMHLVPPGPNVEYSDDETVLGGCFISPVRQDKLHTWGHKNIWYYDTLDPIIHFERSVYRPPYLKPGNIYWNNDKEMAVQTKPVFQKIVRWIRKNWPKPKGFVLYAGPQALKLVDQENAIITSLVPGVELIRVPVHSNE